MARPRNQVPSYRFHKQSGQAIVTITMNGDRKDILLGKYGTPESKVEYERVLACLRTPSGSQVLASGNGISAKLSDLTISEVIDAYRRWADEYYKPTDGKAKPGGTNPKYALRKVREMFGSSLASEFGPKTLKVVREAWVGAGLARKVINGRVGAVKRMFKWAVSEELLPAEAYQRLSTVEGLRVGRTEAPDKPPVRPAVWEDVEKAILSMPEHVGALACIQVQTGARAGELVKLRVGDIDRMNPEAWVYQPSGHKGTWKGKARIIFFGKRSQEILAPLVLKAGHPDAYVFSPARSEAARNAERSVNRVTPKWESHMLRNELKRAGAGRKRAPGARYTTGTYRQAIERACVRAGVPTFTPHRLRHLAATRTREELGVDVARALLGHTLASITEVYSREVDKQLALKAVEKFG
jgi:integrase